MAVTVYLIFFAVLGVLAANAALLYVIAREKSAVWYVGYVAAVWLHYFRNFIIAYYPDSAQAYFAAVPLRWDMPTSYLSYLFYILFALQFLDLPLAAPRLVYLFRVVIGVICVLTGINLVLQMMGKTEWAAAFYQFTRLLFYPLAAYVLALLWKTRQVPLARFIVVGSAALVIGGVANVVMFYTEARREYAIPELVLYFDFSWGRIYLPHFKLGVLVEVVCFMMGIAYRIRLLRTRPEEFRLQRTAIRQSQQPELIAVTDDHPYLNQVRAIILTRMEESEFGVSALCEALLSNRTTVNNKLKKLTGRTTEQFILDARLHHAKMLLENQNQNVSEAMRSVGLDNPQYFSNKFKALFGISPSAVRKAV